MDAKLLRSSIDMLKSIQSELHSSVEKSVIETLDKVIADLEASQQSPGKINAHDLLIVLASVLDKLPAIVEIIHIMSKAQK